MRCVLITLIRLKQLSAQMQYCRSSRQCGALVLTSAFILFLTVACGGTDEKLAPTSTPTGLSQTKQPSATLQRPSSTLTRAPQATGLCEPGTPPSFLSRIVLARDAKGPNYDPVGVTNEFNTSQPKIHAVAKFDGAPHDTQIRAVWYLLDAKGYTPNSQLSESNLELNGVQSADLSLVSNSGAWPVGTYCVEVYVGGNLAFSQHFAVVADSDAQPSSANHVVQMVFAENINPANQAPINPLNQFLKSATVIHASVQIQDAKNGTNFRTRWYPPGQAPIDKELTAGGTQWLDFNIFPVSGGFPTGTYKVELYVNGTLVNTAQFVVN